jgi:hypothetical protein
MVRIALLNQHVLLTDIDEKLGRRLSAEGEDIGMMGEVGLPFAP